MAHPPAISGGSISLTGAEDNADPNTLQLPVLELDNENFKEETDREDYNQMVLNLWVMPHSHLIFKSVTPGMRTPGAG